MSTWQSIEDAIVTALTGLNASGVVLQTIKAVTARDRKVLAAAIGRELLPAGYVMLSGREAPRSGQGGELDLKVLLAARSQRSDDEARRGSEESTGTFGLVELVAGALRGLIVESCYRLEPVGEGCLGGEHGTVLWEQRYAVARLPGAGGVTFGGVLLAGTDSRVEVEAGALRRAASAFAFPGIDGVFQRFLGFRGRTIVWRGQLRAATDGGLDWIEAHIDGELRAGAPRTLADQTGRAFDECVLASFQRHGARRHDAISGQAMQDFEITFEQLSS